MTTAEIIGTLATILAVCGVVLNNHRCIWCFAIWAVSNSLSAGLHIEADMRALALRDGIFLILAADGAWRWSRRPSEPPRTPTNAPQSDERAENDSGGV